MPKLKPSINLNQLNRQLIQRLCKALGIQPIVATLLVSRGIQDIDSARDFLFPNSLNYSDPFELPNMELISTRIQQGVDHNEQITIYGDYDVDGITASTILFHALKIKGASKVNICIPDRHTQGYGLNLKQIEKLKAEGTSLIITVDCGITAHNEIAKCNDYNIDVIVSDHHQVPDEAVPAYAITNSVLLEEAHPMRYLCGAGVAFKIGQALNGFEKMERLSQYAAIGTIADIVSLTGENRLLVYHGLEQINKAPYPGITELVGISGLKSKRVMSDQIAFGLAPRINAAGRIDSPYTALNLFLETDTKQCQILAKKLNELNSERRKQTQQAFDEAEEQIIEEGNIQKQLCLVACGNWNSGVIGIAASKLLELYYRPTILLSKKNDLLVGSARSIPGVNIHAILKECSHLFEKFGGHCAAAGITMKIENYEAFKVLINQQLQRRINKDVFYRTVDYDLLLDSFQINSDTVRQIEMLEPFGQGNPKPRFLSNNMICSNVKKIGNNRQHLSFNGMIGDMTKLNCVYFNAGENAYNYFEKGNGVSVVGALNINTWNNQQRLQFLVNEIVGSDYFKYSGAELTRQDFVSVFVWLKKIKPPIVIKSRSELHRWYCKETETQISKIKFQVIINIFIQVSILKINHQQEKMMVKLNHINGKVDLEKNTQYIDYQNYVKMF